MDSYRTFASVYDLFMDNVPYDDWCDLYSNILKEHGITDGILLDLGCGTGAMTRRFAKRGFDMIGVDASTEMLDMAREADADENASTFGSTEAEGNRILYLQQDMRAFELYGTVAAVVSVCDSMNYILEAEDLLQVFKLVNNYLDPGGLFVFDMTTPYQYENVLGENSFCESRDEAAFLWENDFDPDTRINEYDLTLFVREGAGKEACDTAAQEDERYTRFVETHYQRAWDPDEVIQLLEESGLEPLGIFGADEYQPESPETKEQTIGLRTLQDTDERMYFVARECTK